MLPFPALAAPAFTGENPLKSDTGYATLTWKSAGDAPVEVRLEQASRADMQGPRTIYEGHNEQLFVSGLDNGTYHYTLRGPDGKRSAPLVLEVTHQSLNQALWLTAIGALVFLALVVVILKGARDEH